MSKIKFAIIGPGNIGTDLLVKVLRRSKYLEVGAFVGIDPKSDGLMRAKEMGIPIVSNGIQGLLEMRGFDQIKIASDATSAGAHEVHDAALRARGVRVIDLTPAAIGPYASSVANLEEHIDEHIDEPNLTWSRVAVRRPSRWSSRSH